MKKILILSILGVISTTTFAEKIGYVDTQELFLKYSQTKILRENLAKEKKKLEDALKKQEIELQKLQVDLQGKGNKITDSDKKAFETKVQNFKKSVEESQRKLSMEEAKKMEEVERLITVSIRTVAKNEKIDYVFEQGVMRFGGVDLTQKVLTTMEKSKKIN